MESFLFKCVFFVFFYDWNNQFMDDQVDMSSLARSTTAAYSGTCIPQCIAIEWLLILCLQILPTCLFFPTVCRLLQTIM